jgi:NitT/TauT family transport system substrate-binding protein
MKKLLISIVLISILSAFLIGCSNGQAEDKPIGVAVEFNDHAACAYIAQDKGYFEEAGLNLSSYESYVTGVALASALAQGDIQAAYICLVPAINAYANAGIPIKIVAGTHKYGYGLAVNPDIIKSVEDIEKPSVRLGCVRSGAAADVFLQKTIDKYGLDRDVITGNLQQMDPTKQLLAVKTDRLDAVIVPEHWASMVENYGFEMLLTAKDIWPGMQGSVLIVKEELLNDYPETVRKLVEVSQKSTDFTINNPDEAAEIIARQLRSTGNEIFPVEAAETAKEFDITADVMLRSMERLEYTTDIDPAVIQDTIDYVYSMGYIKSSFSAEEILDLRFINQ